MILLRSAHLALMGQWRDDPIQANREIETWMRQLLSLIHTQYFRGYL